MFTMPDDQFAACAGYDALTYVNFLKLCLRLTFWVTVIMGVMVLPTNWAAGNFIEQQMQLQDNVLAKLQAVDPTYTLEVCENVIPGEDAEEVLAQVHTLFMTRVLAMRVHSTRSSSHPFCDCRRNKMKSQLSATSSTIS